MSSGSELFELLQYRNSHTCLRCLSEPCRKLRCCDCLIRVYSINVVIHVFFDFWKFSIILFNFLINCLDSSFFIIFAILMQNTCLPFWIAFEQDGNTWLEFKSTFILKKIILIQNSSFKLYWSCFLPANDYLVNAIKLTYMNNYNKYFFYNFY